MKQLTFKILGLALFVFLLAACNPDSNVVSPENGMLSRESINTVTPDNGGYAITQEEIDGLIYMRIEEKLARDVYTVLGTTWNAKVFLNIKVSEQAHMDAVKRMLDKYNITDPLITDEVGVFPDPAFQTLYGQLILQGSVSLYEGLLVGVGIEELDIADLENQLANVVTNPGIINLYTNLKNASVNHLAAFNKNLIGCTAASATTE
ncbi:MAG TPA: ferritin [Ignavibacteriales bacterium]|nr:ferritin [Ignavibacteriales bacterium]